MCKYCEGKEVLKSNNFCGSASMLIIGNVIDVYGDKKRFRMFRRIHQPRFTVNFCPMCGAKLSNK